MTDTLSLILHPLILVDNILQAQSGLPSLYFWLHKFQTIAFLPIKNIFSIFHNPRFLLFPQAPVLIFFRANGSVSRNINLLFWISHFCIFYKGYNSPKVFDDFICACNIFWLLTPHSLLLPSHPSNPSSPPFSHLCLLNFVLWPIECIYGYLCDGGFRTDHWKLLGSPTAEGTYQIVSPWTHKYPMGQQGREGFIHKYLFFLVDSWISTPHSPLVFPGITHLLSFQGL